MFQIVLPFINYLFCIPNKFGCLLKHFGLQIPANSCISNSEAQTGPHVHFTHSMRLSLTLHDFQAFHYSVETLFLWNKLSLLFNSSLTEAHHYGDKEITRFK
jgi:hypothetical protein